MRLAGVPRMVALVGTRDRVTIPVVRREAGQGEQDEADGEKQSQVHRGIRVQQGSRPEVRIEASGFSVNGKRRFWQTCADT